MRFQASDDGVEVVDVMGMGKKMGIATAIAITEQCQREGKGDITESECVCESVYSDVRGSVDVAVAA